MEKILTTEEQNMVEVMKAARMVQDFLWSDINEQCGIEEFKRMFRKRVCKIDQIEISNPYWKVELRKRLLQTAAIAVNCITKLDNDLLIKINPDFLSNLPEHEEIVKEGL